VFKLDDWIVWGADMVRTEDGTCHLLFSHLPKENGFDAWLTHSRIGYATAANPEGPYTFQGDRHYAIVKDHDAPYLTKHGKVLHLMESRDGLDWIRSNHSFVEDLDI